MVTRLAGAGISTGFMLDLYGSRYMLLAANACCGESGYGSLGDLNSAILRPNESSLLLCAFALLPGSWTCSSKCCLIVDCGLTATFVDTPTVFILNGDTSLWVESTRKGSYIDFKPSVC